TTDPDTIRNVVLIGPTASGKTSLIEALLAAGGALTRPGAVADGNTVSDHEAGERAHGRSRSLALAPLVYAGTKINLIDTPGDPDFVGELRAGLRAADCALFVIAATDGVDEATTSVWQECAAVGMPRVVAISRIDHPRADYDAVLAQAREALDDTGLPLFLPVGEGEDVAGLVGLISGRFYDYSSDGAPPRTIDDTPGSQTAAAHREALIERIIEESEDEGLMDRYLSGEDVSEEVLLADLERAISRASFHPAVAT